MTSADAQRLPGGQGRDLGAFVRFLLSGGFNTLVTYALYLALCPAFSARASYTIAYVSGIALAYALNRYFVFRTKGSLVAMGLFPAVYLVQYVVGVGIVSLWTDVLRLPEWLAPAPAIAVTLPITFLLSRLLLSPRRRHR